jgi:4-amino-4-deoxy-L-arabinose transferase-like glycosyltransferase
MLGRGREGRMHGARSGARPARGGGPGPGRARTRAALFAIVVAAAALRAFSVWAVAETALDGDEEVYFTRARIVAEGGRFDGVRPPGIWFLNAAVFRALGASPAAARGTSAALGVATVALVFALGRLLAGRRAGLAAAAGAALLPELIAYDHSLWSEPLYVCLGAAGLALLAAQAGAPAPARAAAAGAALAGAALTRDVGALFLPVALGWLLWSGRSAPGAAARAGLAFALAAGLALLPWSVFVNRRSDSFVLISTKTWYNLLIGNCRELAMGPEGPRLRAGMAYRHLGPDVSAREAAARRIALRGIAEQGPAWPLRKIAQEVPKLLDPASAPVKRLLWSPDEPGRAGRRAYRLRPAGLDAAPVRAALAAAAVAGWVALALLGTAGLVLARNRTVSGLFALFAACQVAPTLLAYALPRYRLALVPILLAGAGAWLVEPAALWRAASPRRRALAAAAVLALGALIGARLPAVGAARPARPAQVESSARLAVPAVSPDDVRCVP